LGKSISATCQSDGIVSGSIAASSSSTLWSVWESIWETSATVLRWNTTGGNSLCGGSGSGGLDLGGWLEWSNSGSTSKNTSANGVGVKTERNRQRLVQVVEGHMSENFSEEVSIILAVGNGAGCGVSVPTVSCSGGVVSDTAQIGVVDVWVEWFGLAGQNVFVLHIEVALGTSVDIVNSDAVFGVPPSIAKNIDLVLGWSSWETRITEMTPASVLENVGQSEQVHNISVVSGGSHQRLGNLKLIHGGWLVEGVLPHAFEIVSHGYGGAHCADGDEFHGFCYFF